MGPSIQEYILRLVNQAHALQITIFFPYAHIDTLLSKIKQKFVSPSDYADARDKVYELKQTLAGIESWLDESERNYFRKQNHEGN